MGPNDPSSKLGATMSPLTSPKGKKSEIEYVDVSYNSTVPHFMQLPRLPEIGKSSSIELVV